MKPLLTLKQFLVRRQVLQLYKDLLKGAYKIGDESSRDGIVIWIRSDFKVNKSLANEIDIQAALSRGKLSLRELQTSINMAK